MTTRTNADPASLGALANVNGQTDSHERTDEPGDVLSERWVRSPEYLRTRPIVMLVGSIGALAFYGGATVAVLFFGDSTAATVGGVSLAVAGLVAVAIAGSRFSAARAAFFERQERAAKVDVDEAIEQLGDETDLRGLLRLNRSQMAAYEALTRRQAASSYRLSHVALAVGLVLIAGGAAAALFAEGGATKAATAGLAAVAGTMSGFIARTYLRIYERTLLQLNYYFEQPLVSSYVLTAERLVAKMSPDCQDDALNCIMERLLSRLNSTFEAATIGSAQHPSDLTT